MNSRPAKLLVALAALVAMLIGSFAASAQAEAKAGYKRMTRTEVSYARTVLSLLNSQRAEHGLSRLHVNRALTRGAAGHNRAMARVNVISHQLKGERAYSGRMRAAGWKPRCASGENVGVNADMSRTGVAQLQRLMYAEQAPNDGHRVNILGNRFTHVGIAVLVDSRTDRVWLTVDFGERRC